MSSSTADVQPTQTPVAPKKRKRRVLFWGITLLVLIVALPVVAYFAVLGYIAMGYMDDTVAQKIGTVFNAKASVGGVSTSWLQNVRVERIRVETTDAERPLTVGAVTVDWDLKELYSERHIRSVTVDHPVIDLRRDEKGMWNVALQPSDPHAPSYRIDRINLTEGELGVEWAPGRRARIKSLTGSLDNPPGGLPRAFTLQAGLESQETMSLNGAMGPGSAWNAHLKGALYLERDLKALAGALPAFKGRVRYDAKALRDNGPNLPLAFDGKIWLEQVLWPLAGGSDPLTLSIPEKALSFEGQLRIPTPAPPSTLPGTSLDVETWALDKCRLSADALGELNFNAVLKTAPAEQIELVGGSAALDVDALRKLFTPSLTGDFVTLSGKVGLKDWNLSLPLSETAPPLRATGKLEVPAAIVTLKDIGALPPLNLTCEMDWPQLKEARLKMEGVADARLNVVDLRMPGRDLLDALAANVRLDELKLDLGKLQETEFGRRLATGRLDPKFPAPKAEEIPFFFSGRVESKGLKATVLRSEDSAQLTLASLQLKDISLQRWTLPFKVPAKLFLGQLENIRATFGAGSKSGLNKVEFNGTVSTTTADKDVPPTAFSASMERNAKGVWQPGVVHVSRMAIPLSDLDQVFSITQSSGVKGTGSLIVEDATFNPATGKLDGWLGMENATLRIPVPVAMQSAAVQGLKLTKYASYAPALELSPITEVIFDDVNARLKLTMADGRLQIRGRTEMAYVRVPLLGLAEPQIATVPRLDITLTMDLPGKADRTASASIAWSSTGGNGGDNRIEVSGSESAPNVWKMSGSLALARFGNLKLTIDTPLDMNAKTMGPAVVALGDQDLGAVGANLSQLGVPALNDLPGITGWLKNLKIDVDTVDLASLSMQKIPNLRVTGELEGAGLSSTPVDLEGLTGQFISNVVSNGKSVSANTTVQLSSYSALFNASNFYIPQPPKGKIGALKVASTVSKLSDGSTLIRIDNCEFDLGQLVIATLNGSLSSSPDGTLTKADFPALKLYVPDLKAANESLGKPNLKNRQPWFGDVSLSGGAGFDGGFLFDAGKLSMNGKVNFNGASVALGKSVPLAFSNLRGEFPLVLPLGSSAPPAKINIGGMTIGAISAPAQDLLITPTAEGYRINSPYTVNIPEGQLLISDVALNLVEPKAPSAGQAHAGRQITFRLAERCDLTQLVKKANIVVNGMDGCLLSGAPMACRLYETRDAYGSDWRLETNGGFRGPFFGGEIVVENLFARGLFGPAPVIGVKKISATAPEGIKVTQIVEKNQQFFFSDAERADPDYLPAKFSLRANLDIEDLTFTDLSAAGIQSFKASVRSAKFKDNEYTFNGVLAMWLNRPLVRGAFPEILFSDKAIKQLDFGVRELGLMYELKDGYLCGPTPLLPNNLIIEGYGTEINPFAQIFKKDIKGDYDETLKIWGTRQSWKELMSKATRK